MCKVVYFTGGNGAEAMTKNLEFSVLLDFYGALLTPKQFQVMELYYNEDYSLAEIAQTMGITRQGVYDAEKKSERLLSEYEEKLGLCSRFRRVKADLEAMRGEIQTMQSEMDRQKIIERIEQVLEEV